MSGGTFINGKYRFVFRRNSRDHLRRDSDIAWSAQYVCGLQTKQPSTTSRTNFWYDLWNGFTVGTMPEGADKCAECRVSQQQLDILPSERVYSVFRFWREVTRVVTVQDRELELWV
jgi:hypothetical protein